jgi:small subunit ribosomal protein S1
VQLEAAWARVQEAEKKGTVFEVEVVSANRGGVVVEVEGIKGFLPSSQMQNRDKGERSMEEMMGKMVKVKILTADPEGGRLVFTSRVNNKYDKDGSRKKMTYNVGDVLLGTVQSVQPYGAFVEVQGASGLLHISQISQERVNTMDGVLAVGDKIKVMVLYQEKDNGKLSLTTKKLEPTPGDMLRNPKKVFERAEEMAAAFRTRVAVAEAEAAADETGAPAASA